MGKIIVIGDSIAYGKWDSMGGWVARLRRKVDQEYNIGKSGNVQVYNLGIPGEVAIRATKRAKLEISERINPDEHNLVIIALGINDSCTGNWMTSKQTPENDFKSAIANLITAARDTKCEVVVVGLTPINEGNSNSLGFNNADVLQYDNFLAQSAELAEVPYLSVFTELNTPEYLESMLDAVHPGDSGHEMISNQVWGFLETQGLWERVIKL